MLQSNEPKVLISKERMVSIVVKSDGSLKKKFKGKNDAFVTISLGKEKYQTTVKEKCSDPVEWNEQCEL